MLALCVCAQMGDAVKTTAALPLFEGERPKSSVVLDWLRVAKPMLAADQRALIDGNTPRSLLAYKAATVPPALTAAAAPAAAGGITEAAVAQRDALIIQVQDANALKAEQALAHESEIWLNLFAGN